MAGINRDLQQMKSRLVREALAQYPEHPARTIARLLNTQYPAMFPTIDNARSIIRNYLGTHGSRMRKRTKTRDHFRPAREAGEVWEGMMPESWTEPIEPFILPRLRSLLVLSDIHVPFHDPAALKVAVNYGRNAKVDGVLLNGDTLDFYATSDHEKDPRKIRWSEELDAGRQVLKMMRAAFPNVPIYFKEGNHEYRMEHHLMRHAPVLLGMQEFELPTLLRFGELGIEYVRNKRNVEAGKLNILHGDEWRGGGGVNPARWLALRTKDNALCGHFHRPSSHTDKDVRQGVKGTWTTGCLCELQPAYLPYNEWGHGFAVVHMGEDGAFEVENKRIIHGKILGA